MEYELVERPYDVETRQAIAREAPVKAPEEYVPYWQAGYVARDCAIAIPEQEWGA